MHTLKKPNKDDGFDFIAPFYDFLSRLVFGNSLRKAQVHWLGVVPPDADLLVIGGGSGWFLSQILTTCQPRKVIYIDASSNMITLAQKKVRNDERVDFRIGTETAIHPGDRVDVVFTPFILDLFTEVRLKNRMLPPLLACLRPGGLWISTDFLAPSTWWHRALLWSQYRFFRTLSGIEAEQLPDWVRLLNSLPSIRPVSMTTFLGCMIGSGYWKKVAE